MKAQRMRVKIGVAVVFASALFALIRCSGQDNFYTSDLRSDVYTQLYAIHDYDFLWVLDNSPSMGPKRQYISDNIQTFLNILNSRKAVDFQMAVTNVDYFSNAGNLIAGSSGVTVVKSETSTNPASDFQSIVANDVNTATSFWEQGMIQAYLAIQNNGSNFMRSGVPLAVIFVSDDDDWSCKQMLSGGASCFGIQPENNPDVVLYDTGFFVNFFKNLKAPQNTDVTLFPVVGTVTADCTVERVGIRYQAVANEVGGYSQSGGLCPDQIGNSINNIAQTLANRGIVFPLSQPSNGQGITVYVNSTVVQESPTNGYTFDSSTNSIVFNGNAVPNNGDIVQIVYSQNNN
jgi:hypothetical protein